jgi:hypothetical protein
MKSFGIPITQKQLPSLVSYWKKKKGQVKEKNNTHPFKFQQVLGYSSALM